MEEIFDKVAETVARRVAKEFESQFIIMTPKPVSISKAAELTGISRSCFYGMVKKGEVSMCPGNLSKGHRIPISEINRLNEADRDEGDL